MRTSWLASIFILLLNLSAQALKPDSVYHATPADYGLAYEPLSLPTPDGAQLNAWVYAPDTAKDKDITLVLAYPDAGNMSYYIGQSAYLQQLGYRVITFDYRGFGHSSAFAMDPDQLYYTEFVNDLKAVIGHARSAHPSGKVGLYGLSMGTYVSLSAAASEEVDFLILDSALSDPEAFADLLRQRKGSEVTLPVQDSAHLDKIRRLALPMLLFSGSQDDITPMGPLLPLVSNHPKSSMMVYNGGHLQATASMGWQYYEYMDAFISTLKAGE